MKSLVSLVSLVSFIKSQFDKNCGYTYISEWSMHHSTWWSHPVDIVDYVDIFLGEYYFSLERVYLSEKRVYAYKWRILRNGHSSLSEGYGNTWDAGIGDSLWPPLNDLLCLLERHSELFTPRELEEAERKLRLFKEVVEADNLYIKWEEYE